jgi:addiction module RelE/StbE family toxin
MRIRYSRRAQTDLDAIFSYLNERSPEAASSTLKTIREQIARLGDFPLSAESSKIAGVRGLIILPYPYKAFYRLHGGEIVILHVRDARRGPWKGKS